MEGNVTSSNKGRDSSPPSPPSQKRQRAKQACEPCRLRKRRCDGNMPCNMCTQFEYKCYFERHSRKRSKLVEQHANANGHTEAPAPDSPVESRPSVEELSKLRSMEANSGIAFTRLLGMRLDPSSGPKLFTFGWNLGSSTMLSAPAVAPITSFVDQDQIFSFAKIYFDHVHPLYGFLDKDWIWQNMALRWVKPEACEVPDHVFYGITALGILFSTGEMTPILPGLVDAQKQVLESSSTMRPPTLRDVQSWVLRCLFLRATDHPHAVWIATCTTMHLIEAIGLHQDASTSILHPAVGNGSNNAEIRRRTFWIARMLNTWVSFEYGRTRVGLRAITAALPTSKDGDYTTDYINLYSISCCLDPEQSDKAPQWEEFLAQLDAYEPRHDGIMLSKANLALCGYRRLRLASPNLSSEVINRIISIGLAGLEAARRMANAGMKWWHISNVPFQVICVFLAMDVRESLSHLAAAMRTLEFVVDKFHTLAMKDALKTARFLIRLSKKRKEEDSDVLGATLKRDAPEIDDHAALSENDRPHARSHATNGHDDTPMTAASSDDWSLDVLNNSEFDWNFFLTAEMPAFNNFAPDGTM